MGPEPLYYLVGVLQNQVFAFLQLHADVYDAAQNCPGIVHVQVDLLCKLHRLELLSAQNGVFGRILHIDTGNVPVVGGMAKTNLSQSLKQCQVSHKICIMGREFSL